MKDRPQTPDGHGDVVGGAAEGGQDAIRPRSAPVLIERSPQSLLLQARVGLAVGIIGFLVAAFVLVSTANFRSDQTDIADAGQAAELVALRVSTWSGSDMQSFVTDLRTLVTDDYDPQIERTFTPELQQVLAQYQVQSVGEVILSAVQDVDGDRAQAFVRISQEFTIPGRPVPVRDQIDYEIALQRVDGQWLADQIVALGPTQFELITEDGTALPEAGALPPDADEGAPGSDDLPAPPAQEEGS